MEQESLDKRDLWGREVGEAFQAGDAKAHTWGQRGSLRMPYDVCVLSALDRREDWTLGGEDFLGLPPSRCSQSSFQDPLCLSKKKGVSTARGVVAKEKQKSLPPLPESPLDWGSDELAVGAFLKGSRMGYC